MFHWKKNSIQKQRYPSACSFHFTCSLASRSFQSISISQWLLKINNGENGRKEDDDKQLNRCIWTDGREHPLNSLSICVGFCANAIESLWSQEKLFLNWTMYTAMHRCWSSSFFLFNAFPDQTWTEKGSTSKWKILFVISPGHKKQIKQIKYSSLAWDTSLQSTCKSTEWKWYV